jgi:Fe-S oxidoreductase
LYQRSRIKKEKLSRKAQRELQRREEEKLAENTYKPVINENAHKFYKRSYKLPTAETLYEVKCKVDMKIQRKREEIEKQKSDELPFQPTLSDNTQMISAKKVKRESTVHDDLFVNASQSMQAREASQLGAEIQRS